MFTDFYTGKQYKGSGITDHVGNKIHSDTVVPVFGCPKSFIASKNDPTILQDAVYPNRYIYRGNSLNHLAFPYLGKSYDFGWTSEHVMYLVPIVNDKGSTYYCGTVEQAKTLPEIVEHLGTGMFVHKSVVGNLGNNHYERFKHPKFDKSSYRDLMKYGVISPTCLISEGKRYTFGIEIETCSGYVPKYLQRDLNMDCQYDGSIHDESGRKDVGGEYTTGVLMGDNGFAHLYKICYELSRRCRVNNTCSIHVHLGNITFNKEFVVLVYKVLEQIEGELFDMMPPSRRVREHCRPMKKLDINLRKRGIPYDIMIDKYYKTIVKMVSLGQDVGPRINKSVNHPQGRYCNYDRSTPRYWWANFVPTLFNIKGLGNYTLEIRNHSATMDFIKIKNWILICMGIVSYVENHKTEIVSGRKISITDIVKATYPGKGQYLADYIKERTKTFAEGGLSSERLEYDPKYNINNVVPSNIKKVVMM